VLGRRRNIGALGLFLDRGHDGGIGSPLDGKEGADVSRTHMLPEELSAQRSVSISQRHACKYVLLPGAAHGAVGLGTLPGSDHQVFVHYVGLQVPEGLGRIGALLALASKGTGGGGGHVD